MHLLRRYDAQFIEQTNYHLNVSRTIKQVTFFRMKFIDLIKTEIRGFVIFRFLFDMNTFFT